MIDSQLIKMSKTDDSDNDISFKTSPICTYHGCNQHLILTVCKDFYKWKVDQFRNCSNCWKMLWSNSKIWVCPANHFINFDLCIECERKQRPSQSFESQV